MKHGGKGPVSVKKQITVSIPGLAFRGQFEESDFRATASPLYKPAPGAWDLSDYTTPSLETKSKLLRLPKCLHCFPRILAPSSPDIGLISFPHSVIYFLFPLGTLGQPFLGGI